MFRNRLHVLALAGLALFLCAGVGAQEAPIGLQPDDNTPQQGLSVRPRDTNTAQRADASARPSDQDSAPPEDNPYEPGARGFDFKPSISNPELKPDQTDSGREEERSEEDLLAQQSMANAAWAMFWAVVVQTLVTIIGVWLVRGTLIETRYATKEAGRAATAAIDAVAVTRQIGERQVRAYVHVEKVTLEHVSDEEQPSINVKYRNFGQSPAHRVVNKVSIGFVSGAPTGLRPKERRAEEAGYTLAPGQHNTATSFVWLDGIVGNRKALEGGAAAMFVYGEITYVDAFDQPRFSRYRFRLHVNPEGLVDTDSFVICKEGNESD